MSQQGSFVHRSSVPTNFYQQYDQPSNQTQDRSYSVSNASFQSTRSAVASPVGPQWRDRQSYLPSGTIASWQPQQQYAQTQGRPQQVNSINNNNLLDDIGDLLQYRSPNDAPWNAQTSQQHAPQTFNSEQFRMQGSGAATVVPDTRSQSRSFANDSAYYSQSSHKRSTPSDDLSQQITDPFLSPAQTGRAQFTGNGSPRSVASDTQVYKKPRRSPANTLKCPREGCLKSDLKNRSDLQKHINQHDKPFICEEAGCERDEGFGTSNDLERHRASVHALQQRCGTTVGFVCAACEQVDSSQKWWPRKDNFKSHIRRKHVAEWDENELIEISAKDCRPADAMTEIRSATSRHGNGEDRLQRDFGWPHGQSYQATVQLSSPDNDGDILAGGGQWASGDPAARQIMPDTMQMSRMTHTNELLSPSTATGRFEQPSPLSLTRMQDIAIPLLQITGTGRDSPAHQLDTLGWNQPTTGSRSIAGSSQGASQSNGGYKCTMCNKVKKRACDLRKHEKRHTRPYGCTFPRCFKRFGSRNDWKRHENAQHMLNEQWRCQLPNHDGSACARLFEKEEDMSAHLDNRHGNEGYRHDNPLHSTAINSFHLGHEGHHNFWCGFCNNLVEQRENMHQGNQDPRFQHIGNHFDKDKWTIDDWVDIEENKKKRFITPPKSAKQAVRDSSADESDLGDDGIPDPAAFVAGYTAPVGGLAGYGTDLPVRGSLYTTNKRLDLDDDDADGESDHEFSRRMI